MPKRTLRANFASDTEALVHVENLQGVARQLALSEARTVDFTQTRPVHQSVAYPRRRNIEGRHWMATTRTSVTFESMLERDFLIWADWTPNIVDVWPQPFDLLWPRGTQKHKSHVPDYALALTKHRLRVVDVRAASLLGSRAEEQFALTREACKTAGWEYEVWKGMPEPEAGRIRWLSGYRTDRHSPRDESTRAALLNAFQQPSPLADGLAAARFAASDVPEAELRGATYHLLWHHDLKCDMTQPLSEDTEVRTAK